MRKVRLGLQSHTILRRHGSTALDAPTLQQSHKNKAEVGSLSSVVCVQLEGAASSKENSSGRSTEIVPPELILRKVGLLPDHK